MLYIETDKQISISFSDELEAMGLPREFQDTTRRIIDGKVSKGHPRAIGIDVDESRRADVQAVIDAHVPDFGHVATKIAETKAEAGRRILTILPDWKQRNYTARAIEKVASGEVGDDEWNEMQAVWRKVNAVRTASDVIEAEISALTDEEAGAFDPSISSHWPE